MFAGSAFSEVPFSSVVPESVVVSVTNVYAACVTGSVVVTGTANVFPTGVIGYGAIGNVNIWQLVPTVQSANWVPVNT